MVFGVYERVASVESGQMQWLWDKEMMRKGSQVGRLFLKVV